MAAQIRNLLFVFFALSGFSGLIYESIWTHYLKLFLGHAAYAQTLVLAIFMGGMALGSWISSRYSDRWKNLLGVYALTEAAIGVCALFFHTVFVSSTDASYSYIFPRLGSPAAIVIYKWSLSALLILPQSILLGMTFPLMTAGLMRLFPDRPGSSVAMVYFTNSMGAACGVLTSGFILIKEWGLPGTITVAGLINILLAAGVWGLVRGTTGLPARSEAVTRGEDTSGRRGSARLLLLVSLLTGTASFIYEIGWIRMLSLVLGSSTHAFELMLSAFIFGLAFGGLWIHRRIDSHAEPVRLLAIIQFIMGLLALSTLLIYGNTFEAMRWLMASLGKTDTGYVLFNVSCNAIALIVMLPTTFCAGMTLPLITGILMQRRYGEKSIGAVYAANTVGAIVGVFFAVHAGLPFLGLKGLITFGASIDIALGLFLLWSVSIRTGNRSLAVAGSVLCVSAVAGVLLFVRLDQYKMASGVYRSGTLLSPQDVSLKYHRDGKTSSVSILLDTDGVMAISTNGKVDAAISTNPDAAASPDETTNVLAAAIPLGLHPRVRTVANIGLGSGLTTQTLLADPQIERVDTVEIEAMMIEAARLYGPLVSRVYTDPRSRIYLDDAKTFFSVNRSRYDIIISEPSNPWVSGVAGLYSDEFYRMITGHLNRGGLFVQWVQLYETDMSLVSSILKAVSRNFSDYVIYATTGVNVAIVATNDGTIGRIDPSRLSSPELAGALKRIQVEGMQDLEVRNLGNKELFDEMLGTFKIRANSDYYPVLDQHAARTRFLGSYALDLLSIAQNSLPVLEMLGASGEREKETRSTPSISYPKSLSVRAAMAFRDYLLQGEFDPSSAGLGADFRKQIVDFREQMLTCVHARDGQDAWIRSFLDTAVMMLPYLSPSELDRVWKALNVASCGPRLSPAERHWLSLFQAVGKRDGATMAVTARSILEEDPPVSADALRYLVASGMLGSLEQGQKADSLALWTRHGQRLFKNGEPDLLFRLLLAKSSAP
ncbi:MAG: spermidine synthase [Nitrospirae bacterium]|nr:MAG: spermidine synthase [Nitrospirota bacterium]